MAALNIVNYLVSSNATQTANNNYLLCQKLTDVGLLPQQLLYPSNASQTVKPPLPPQPAEQVPTSYLELTAGQISELLNTDLSAAPANPPPTDSWNRRRQLKPIHLYPKTCSEDLMNRVLFRLTNELHKILSRDISRCLIEQTAYKTLDKYWTSHREREQTHGYDMTRNDNEKPSHYMNHHSKSPTLSNNNDINDESNMRKKSKSPLQNSTSSSRFRIPILYYGQRHRRSLAGMNHMKHRGSNKISSKSRTDNMKEKENSNKLKNKYQDRHEKTASSSSSDNDETYSPKIKSKLKNYNRLNSYSPKRSGNSKSKSNNDALQEEDVKVFPTDQHRGNLLVTNSRSSSSSSKSNSSVDVSTHSEPSSGSEPESEYKRSKTKKVLNKLSIKRNAITDIYNNDKFNDDPHDAPSTDTTILNTSTVEDDNTSFIEPIVNLNSDADKIDPDQFQQEPSPIKDKPIEDLETRIDQPDPIPHTTDAKKIGLSDSDSDSDAYFSHSNNIDGLCNWNTGLNDDIQPWFNKDPSLWSRDPAILKKFAPALKPSFPQQSRRFPKRTPWERAKIIDQFLEDGGFDQEDTMMLMYAYIRLKSQNSHLVKNVPWAYHPLKPDADKNPTQTVDDFGVSISKKKKYVKSSLPDNVLHDHVTGSSRSEGFYRLSLKEKLIQRGLLGNTERLRGWKENYDVIQTSRDSRATQRRLATDCNLADIPTELAKTNLLHRKKLLCFAKSRIHNWGLFTLEPIAYDELVIEYVGESIRSSVGDVREKRYESEGMGCSYMFRVDSDYIIDATKQGNLARFINHSCDPNCYAKIIPVGTQKRIAIYSKRDIEVNEEITYDYKFPIEDKKIPCYCGASACRGSLN